MKWHLLETNKKITIDVKIAHFHKAVDTSTQSAKIFVLEDQLSIDTFYFIEYFYAKAERNREIL
jgi:hypothetical protein